eukprot:gene10758-7486_t
MRCVRVLRRWTPASIAHLPDVPSVSGAALRPVEEKQRQSRPLSLKAREELSSKATQLRYHVVTEEWAGQRVDAFLVQHHPEWDYTAMKKLVQNGHIYRYRRRGKRTYTRLTDRLEFDELLVVPTPAYWKEVLNGPSELMREQEEQRSKGPSFHLSRNVMEMAHKMVLYKNEHVIVINKPSGVPMMPTRNPLEMNIAAMLPAWKFTNPHKPIVCHNLDRETSGCVVLARTPGAHRQLGRMFVKRVVPNSVYWGFCVGKPSVNFGRIRMHFEVRPDEKGGKGMIIARPSPTRDTKVALAEFVVNANALEYGSFVSFYPLTARRHQERIMAAHALRCPVLGDARYGGEAAFPSSLSMFQDPDDKSIPLHLHHRKIQLPYKSSAGEFVCITAPLPEYMKKTFQRLGWPCDADDPLIPG